MTLQATRDKSLFIGQLMGRSPDISTHASDPTVAVIGNSPGGDGLLDESQTKTDVRLRRVCVCVCVCVCVVCV